MILILLPTSDYDPTESSVPWQAMRQAGIEVCFASPEGLPAYADSRLVDIGFGPLTPLLMTRKADLASYARMTEDPSFRKPLSYDEIDPSEFQGLLIPGGHAKGMRSLLESEQARRIALHFFTSDKPVAAVCHGVLLLARTLDPDFGLSVLQGHRTGGQHHGAASLGNYRRLARALLPNLSSNRRSGSHRRPVQPDGFPARSRHGGT